MSFEDLEASIEARKKRATTSARELQIVDEDDYHDRWLNARNLADKDDLHRLLAVQYEDFRNLLSPKALGQTSECMVDDLMGLRGAFPNFTHVLEEFEGAAYRGLRRKYRELPDLKILLLGPPGIGKTTFVEAVAKVFGQKSHRVSVGGKPAVFELKGLGRHWQNAAPGAIARIFAESAVANPFIILDEIDKCRDAFSSFGRSQDVILELAEPVNARHFRDEYLEIDIDVSNSIIIATANDVSALSEALLSRFHVIEICSPTPAQNHRVIQQIYSTLIQDESDVFEPVLSDMVIGLLELMTPRVARLKLSRALGAAAKRSFQIKDDQGKRVKLEISDLQENGLPKPNRRIGFVVDP